MPTDENRRRIDEWIALAPETRVVETTRSGAHWTTQALDDGELRYEETELGGDEPQLNLLTAWCELQVMKANLRPLVKTGATVIDLLERKRKRQG